MLPEELKKGDRLPAGWLNRLVREILSRTLSAGPGIRIIRTPSGSTISATGHSRPQAAAGTPDIDFPWRVTATPDGDGNATISMSDGIAFNIGRRALHEVSLSGIATASETCWVVLDYSLDATVSAAPAATVQSGWASRNTADNLCVPVAHVKKDGTSGEWTIVQYLVGAFIYQTYVGEEA